jgi:hypothetical protein
MEAINMKCLNKENVEFLNEALKSGVIIEDKKTETISPKNQLNGSQLNRLQDNITEIIDPISSKNNILNKVNYFSIIDIDKLNEMKMSNEELKKFIDFGDYMISSIRNRIIRIGLNLQYNPQLNLYEEFANYLGRIKDWMNDYDSFNNFMDEYLYDIFIKKENEW